VDGRVITEFVWHAELSVSNEYGELALAHVENSGTVNGLFNEAQLEVSAIEWALANTDYDPNMVEVVNFVWSTAVFDNAEEVN
jgi:hypothetical protein